MGHLEGAVEWVEGQRCGWVYPSAHGLQQLHLNLISSWGIEFCRLQTSNCARTLLCKWKNWGLERKTFSQGNRATALGRQNQADSRATLPTQSPSHKGRPVLDSPIHFRVVLPLPPAKSHLRKLARDKGGGSETSTSGTTFREVPKIQ